MGIGLTPGGQIGLATVMLVLCTSAIFARFCARKIRKAAYSWDDWTLLVAWLFTFAQIVGIWIGAGKGAVGGHSTFDDEGYPVLDALLTDFYKVSYASYFTSVVAVGLTKISVLLLYRRIFNGSTSRLWFNAATWGLLGLTIIWTISFFFANLLECPTISTNWTTYGGDETCINITLMNFYQCWSDTLLDFLILLVPIPCVWVLHMPLKQKVAVTGMFLLGAVTLAMSITRLVYLYQIAGILDTQGPDVMYFSSPILHWPMVESALGVTAACLPLLKPIFDDYLPFTRLTSYLSSLGSKQTSRATDGPSAKNTNHSDLEKDGSVIRAAELN